MGILIANLVGFVVVIAVLAKYAAPPVRAAMKKQQDAVGQQIADSEAAKKRLVEAQEAHANAVEEARSTASQIREEARGDAQAITEDMSAAADAEVKRISEHGKTQIELNRASLIRGLRADLGLTSVDVASNLVREHLSSDGAREASIDRAITELEQMVGSTNAVTSHVSAPSELVGLHSMRAASRDAVRTVTSEFDSRVASMDSSQLTGLASELADVVDLLGREPVLRKHLAEPSDDADTKTALVRSVLGSSLSDNALALITAASNARWSATSDLPFAIERFARYALLIVAEKAGTIDRVEDELFRLGRLLLAQPELTTLLSNTRTPASGRTDLVNSVIGGKVDSVTKALADQTIRLLRGQNAATAISDLAELAAARRGESVAHVVAAVMPSQQQQERIAAVLGQIYRRSVSTQIEVDSTLLGGIRVSVGDEVIDADVATRLARAADELPT